MLTLGALKEGDGADFLTTVCNPNRTMMVVLINTVHVAVTQTAQKPLDVGDNDDDDVFTQGFQPVPMCHINS